MSQASPQKSTRRKRYMIVVAAIALAALAVPALQGTGAFFNSQKGGSLGASTGTIDLEAIGDDSQFNLQVEELLEPGKSGTTIMKVRNKGTLPGSLVVTNIAGVDCTAGINGDPTPAESAAKILVGVEDAAESTVISAPKPAATYTGNLALNVLGANEYKEFPFSLGLDESAGNNFQGVDCSGVITVTLAQVA